MPEDEHLSTRLAASARRAVGGSLAIRDLTRLTGGASQESWRFTLIDGDASETLVLRRAPPGRGRGGFATVDLATEARLLAAAGAHGVPVPAVHWTLTAEDGLGEGYVMTAAAGETRPKRILGDTAFETVRHDLARQCGATLARLHAIPAHEMPALPRMDASMQLEQLRTLYDSFGEKRPVLEAAFVWLADNAPETEADTLVHGDFRNGNLMVDADAGVTAVLDWELAHAGDPMEDLGWLCVPSWRFGVHDRPVGGFGERADLFTGYADVAGRPVDAERVAYWQVFGTLKWGVICLVQAFTHLSGQVRSVELAAIGRRVSEAEIDLLDQLCPRERADPPAAAAASGQRPRADELLAAVSGFLRDEAAPGLAGRSRFHARVAANAADIAARDARLGPAARAGEAERLQTLVGGTGDRDRLNAALCAAIRDGRLGLENEALADHLWATTVSALAIDQPTYATYRRLTGGR